MDFHLAQKLVMSLYSATSSRVILHAWLMDSYISCRYASNTISFSFFFLASGLALRMQYLAPPGCGVVAKMAYSGSRHSMKAMRVINHE
jgi:hypothetical protein